MAVLEQGASTRMTRRNGLPNIFAGLNGSDIQYLRSLAQSTHQHHNHVVAMPVPDDSSPEPVHQHHFNVPAVVDAVADSDSDMEQEEDDHQSIVDR